MFIINILNQFGSVWNSLEWFETDLDFSNWKPSSFKLIGIFPNQTI